MGKLEKYIYLVIILVLVTAIVSGSIYLVMRDKDNTNTDNNKEINDKDKESNDNKDNEKEEITLSEYELNDYLSYVPNINDNVVYKKDEVSVSDYDTKALTEMALNNSYSCWEQKICDFDMNMNLKVNNASAFYYEGEYAGVYFPLDFINSKLNRMYNVKLSDVKESTSVDDVYNSGLSYIYQDEYFLAIGGGYSGNKHVSLIDKYDVSYSEIVIYEVAAYYDQDKMVDYYNNYSVSVSSNDLSGYLKDNKDKFTKYKHTFKKNVTGYYWYQTEVVKN